jgi:hypothetical protein
LQCYVIEVVGREDRQVCPFSKVLAQ